MGSGAWSSQTYTSHTTARASAGIPTFDHYANVRSGAVAAEVHELLDPLKVAGPTSPFAGKVMREVAISDEHPHPTPIVIGLDVTGSNIDAAHAVHAKLPKLFGVLQQLGGIEDPQVLIAATGDATCDQFPLQVGQFESDNRIDTMVEAMILEGGGGGQKRETYETLAYYLWKHTHLEIVEKQGRKGYAIFIGDEMPYQTVKKDFGPGWGSAHHTLKSLTGDNVEADIPTAEVFEGLKEQYEVLFLFQKQGNYQASEILPEWRKYIGENALVLEDPNNVCEFIAGLLAMREAGLDADEAVAQLVEAGFDEKASQSVGKALATVGGGGGGGAVAKTEGSLDVSGDTGADRL